MKKIKQHFHLIIIILIILLIVPIVYYFIYVLPNYNEAKLKLLEDQVHQAELQ